MDDLEKSKILQRLVYLKNLKRELEDLAKQLNISDISDDKIYSGIVTAHAVLSSLMKED